MLSKSLLINIKPVLLERGFLEITRHQFHFYDSVAFAEMEDKTPSIITKMLSFLLSLGMLSPRIWGAVSQELWMQNKYMWEIYFCHLNDQIYIFPINHCCWELGSKIEKWTMSLTLYDGYKGSRAILWTEGIGPKAELTGIMHCGKKVKRSSHCIKWGRGTHDFKRNFITMQISYKGK